MQTSAELNSVARPAVNCIIHEGVARIAIDDGKGNALSPSLIAQINKALDKAESAGAIVVIEGREGVFSAGFDLSVLKTGVGAAYTMLIEGFKLARRLLAFPRPVILVSAGHAIAMGAFLVLSADYRIGLRGDYRYVANEVEIGLTMPHAAVEICRQRLSTSCFHRAVNLSEVFSPERAVEEGFLDAVTSAEELDELLATTLDRFSSLDSKAHKQTKLRARQTSLRAIDRAITRDRIDFVKMGVRRALSL